MLNADQSRLQPFIYRLIAVAYIATVFLTSSFFFVVAVCLWLLTAAIDPRLWLLHRLTCFWASLYIWMMPAWSVKIYGKENIDPKETYIIVSNHQSLVDILVAFTLFIHFKWVSKAELFHVPLIGWNMSLNRYIKLRRGKSDSIKQMYATCEKHLKQGSSIYLFPEGTRSETGKMRPFKEGAFILAKRMNRPILPLVINGSSTALPKNSFNFHGKTRIEVTVLPPIDPADFGDGAARELAGDVRARIESHLAPRE